MTFIFIDSSKENCIPESSTKFKYLLSKPIVFKKITLLYAAIPYSWYLINQYNCNFIVHFNDGATITAWIGFGNYNVNSLATTKKNLVNYSSFDMTFDSLTMKYVFSAPQNFEFQICSNSLNYVIGLDDWQVSKSSHILTLNILINFLNYTILHLKIKNFCNNIVEDNSFDYTFIISNIVDKNKFVFTIIILNLIMKSNSIMINLEIHPT